MTHHDCNMWNATDELHQPSMPMMGTYTGPRFCIEPDGSFAPIMSSGDINLYTPAGRVFSQLDQDNVFTGGRNTFQGMVTMNRCHILSDRSQKTKIQPLDAAAAEELVRTLEPVTYQLGGQPGSGFLADAVPEMYALCDDARRPVAVDYQGLLAELWGAVRRLQDRVSALETQPRGEIVISKEEDNVDAADHDDP